MQILDGVVQHFGVKRTVECLIHMYVLLTDIFTLLLSLRC